jgi:hypothetical protein
MSAVLTSHYQIPLHASDQNEIGSPKVSGFRDWVNGELDKIQLSARLLGVCVNYMPTYEGRKLGLLERQKDDAFGAMCQVKSEPLLGTLFFFCDGPIVEQKIRVPGINSEYRCYDYNGQEKLEVPDENGNIAEIRYYGPHRYEIHHSTGNDLI